MPMHGRAQRPTLTYAQMYGNGYQEGMGLWDSFKKWVGKAAKTAKKGLKKTKLISRVGSIAGPLAAAAGRPGVSAAIAAGTAFAKQHGYGTVLAGGRYKGKVKNISPIQHMALKKGLGRMLPGGGVSMVAAKRMYPRIKNISAAQVKALAAYRGRKLSGGGISLAVRAASPRTRKKPMGSGPGIYGTGYSGMGMTAAGLKLAGQGPYVGMGSGRRGYKKKRHLRKKPVIVYRM